MTVSTVILSFYHGGIMNIWTKMSIDLANQHNYLDLLFRVYPTIPENCRYIDKKIWTAVEKYFYAQDNIKLIKELLKLKLFPIKDSYVAYLKHDHSAIERNPETINRLAGRVFEMGIDKLFEKCSEPKETNRQIGPLFKRWLNSGILGITPVTISDFLKTTRNAVLDASDAEMKKFAQEYLGYNRDKGLDFVGRFNGKYIIGEAKFLTDFGGHQNAQIADALSTLNAECNAVKIAILDGVCYIPGNHKLYNALQQDNAYIMSALVLREFLYQV